MKAFILLLRQPQPAMPILGLDIIRYGSKPFDLSKMKNDLEVQPADPLLAVDKTLIWFANNGYFKGK